MPVSLSTKWYLLLAEQAVLTTEKEYFYSNRWRVNLTIRDTGPTEDISPDSHIAWQIGATLICMFLWFLSWCVWRENLSFAHWEPQDCLHWILDVVPADQKSVKWIQVGELLFASLAKLEAIRCCWQMNWSQFCPQFDQLRPPCFSCPPSTDQNCHDLLL